ncbi:hypothetical protein [Yoonia litorea]|uniref:Uncharacterized protein n=1 Tax=Yoonia litorea TaxID=1123755 RepID=A0A1I6LAQ3_9RHOB|nr:hypothetical protein [Yoonia litorea]SFS00552.1 hypothetical protein SAMN05444714_0350 [Yoonia litorea]
MKQLVHFLVGLFMPLILIAGGAGVIGIGMTYDIVALAWAGLAMIAAGIVWGLVLYFWADSGLW